MPIVMQERNMVELWRNDVFEWKVEFSDLSRSSIADHLYTATPVFKVGGNETCALGMKYLSDREWILLHIFHSKSNHSRIERIIISDKNKSIIYNVDVNADDCLKYTYQNRITVNIGSLPSKHFPLCITGIVSWPNIHLSHKQPQTTEKVTITDELYLTDSTPMTEGTELSVDFKKILDNPIYSDVVLKAENESIKAHKVVLHARSPVFQKMLSHETTKTAENTIVISDISAAVMKKLVAYLYTGEKEKCSFEECCELYYAADKYEVLSLREACRVEMLNHLQVDNACALFSLANRHTDEVLVKEVVRFINANFKSVIETKSFDELKKEEMKCLVQSHTRSMN